MVRAHMHTYTHTHTHTQTCEVGKQLVPPHVENKSHTVAIPCSRKFPVECKTTRQQYKYFCLSSSFMT